MINNRELPSSFKQRRHQLGKECQRSMTACNGVGADALEQEEEQWPWLATARRCSVATPVTPELGTAAPRGVQEQSACSQVPQHRVDTGLSLPWLHVWPCGVLAHASALAGCWKQQGCTYSRSTHVSTEGCALGGLALSFWGAGGWWPLLLRGEGVHNVWKGHIVTERHLEIFRCMLTFSCSLGL